MNLKTYPNTSEKKRENTFVEGALNVESFSQLDTSR